LKSIHKISLLFILTVFSASTLYGQTLYRTYAGHLIVAGKYRDVPLKSESHAMYMLINYETAEIEIYLDLKTLISNHDSLNKTLLGGGDKLLIFKGKMQIPFVNTQGHPRQKFPVDGSLSINDITHPFVFEATLVHLEGDNLACSLSGEFVFYLDSFFPKMLNEGFDNHVHVKFWEIILERINE
jgi:hypothetical protein